jgi:hypothetical protein
MPASVRTLLSHMVSAPMKFMLAIRLNVSKNRFIDEIIQLFCRLLWQQLPVEGIIKIQVVLSAQPDRHSVNELIE